MNGCQIRCVPLSILWSSWRTATTLMNCANLIAFHAWRLICRQQIQIRMRCPSRPNQNSLDGPQLRCRWASFTAIQNRPSMSGLSTLSSRSLCERQQPKRVVPQPPSHVPTLAGQRLLKSALLFTRSVSTAPPFRPLHFSSLTANQLPSAAGLLPAEVPSAKRDCVPLAETVCEKQLGELHDFISNR